jgi:4-hydroxythreonine-4-phosphate dehydrogenase
MGDAAGVGPEIALKAYARGLMPWEFMLFGDLAILELCNEKLGYDVELRPVKHAHHARHGRFNVCDLGVLNPEELRVGEVCEASGRAALEYLRVATQDAMLHIVDALVTLPMNKEATRLTAPDFSGHTGYIAAACGETDYAMMLAAPSVLATFVSTHVPLRAAVEDLNADRIHKVIVLTDQATRTLNRNRRIAVMALNPHAGEGGAFGDEETRYIRPAVERARGEGIDAVGPLPPDTVFMRAVDGEFGAVVCMYHDQGHIPLKLVAFEESVNVTLGLPIIRTSVDHGTAFDIAWQGKASITSFVNACRLAEKMVPDDPDLVWE